MKKVQSKKPYFRTLTQGNLKFVLNGKTKDAGVLCLSENCDEVTIPTFINYGTVKYAVTSILENAFQVPCAITNVKFEGDSKLLKIGKRAFYHSIIKHIDIPDSVQEICDKAFYKCDHLFGNCKITISNKSQLRKIGKKAFYGLSIGPDFHLPDCIEEIGDYAFAYCPNLTDVNFLLTNLRTIGKKSFCSSYISFIKLPSTLKYINDEAFQMPNLQYIELSANTEIIGKAAFANTNIQTIFIPRKVEKIDDSAFENSSLSKIEFSQNSMLKTIGESAFSNCELVYIKIPSNCEIIGKKAFAKCKNLCCVDFEKKSKLETIDEFAFSESMLAKFTIPPNLKEVKKGWLNNCQELKKISCDKDNELFKIEDFGSKLLKKSSIEKVEFDTFIFCVKQNIQKVEIPDSIEIIDSYAFESCKFLQSIEISNYSNLRVIGEGAFAFTQIESFTFPPKLEELNTGWCYGMSHLKRIDVSPQNPLFSSVDDGKIVFKKSSIEKVESDIFVFSARNNENVTIPSSIEVIDAYAFDCCRNLSKVELPSDSKLRLINDFAFFYSSIESIFIPSTVTKIGKSAFSNSDLRKIEIQANSQLHEIKEQAFESTKIVRFVSPRSLKKIGKLCFSMCQHLRKFVNPVDSEIEEIGEKAFESTFIESFRIPVHLREIENETFKQSFLKNVEFPENCHLITIGSDVFNGTNIENLSIPSCVTAIKKFAFNRCIRLNRLIIPQNSKLISIKKGTFMVTAIMSFHIPPQIKHLGKDIFENCSSLAIVELDENSELDTFNVEFLGYCKQEREPPMIMIPSNMRKLLTRKKITVVK